MHSCVWSTIASPNAARNVPLVAAWRRICSISSANRTPYTTKSCTALTNDNAAQLLSRFRQRARELLLTDFNPDGAVGAHQLIPHVTNVQDNGLFSVVVRKSSAYSSLTLDESLTLLSNLFAIALKGQRSGSMLDFTCSFPSFKISPVCSNSRPFVLLPLRAAEAAVSPLSRQVRLWSVQKEWWEVVACAAAVFDRLAKEGQGGGSGGSPVQDGSLQATLQSFLDKLDLVCLPREREVVCFSEKKKRSPKSAGAVTNRDSLVNVLWRSALMCRLLEGVLCLADGVAEERAKRLRDVSFTLFCALEKRHFTLVDRNGVTAVVKGLTALVNRAFQRNCGGGSANSIAVGERSWMNEERHENAYKGELAEALVSFCTAYYKLVPASLSAEVFHFTTNGDREPKRRNSSAVDVARAVRECWYRWKDTLHLHGVEAAFWWLRLVPPLLESFMGVAALLEGNGREKCPTDHPDAGRGLTFDHVSDDADDPVSIMRKELLTTLCDVLFFDEKAFDKRVAALSARQAMKDAEANDGSVASSGEAGVVSEMSRASEECSVEGDEAQLLPRPRGGRSMLRKVGEGGVLLPNSAEPQHMPSRFSSRRSRGAHGLGASTLTRGIVGNASARAESSSPLFDIIAASSDSIAQLAGVFSVEASYRTPVLESLWLTLLAAHRHIERDGTLMPFSSLNEPELACRETTGRRTGGRLGSSSSSFLAVVSPSEANDVTTKQSLLPSFVSSGLRHLISAIAAATLRAYELADTTVLRYDKIKRSIGVSLVAGAQATLLDNQFHSDALVCNWWLHSGAFFSPTSHLRQSLMLEKHLLGLISVRFRYRGDVTWLKDSTAIALHCISTVPLSASAKQWGSALIMSNLRDMVILLRKSGSSPVERESAEGVGPNGSLSELKVWACESFLSLLTALLSDVELLLLCGYAGFVDAMYEVYAYLGVEREEVVRFSVEGLLKHVLPAVLLGITKSSAEDNAETHSAACESAIGVLAELARFALLLDPKSQPIHYTVEGGFLVEVAVYCLRHARCSGGERACSSIFLAGYLPRAEGAMEDVKRKCGPTVSFMLSRGTRSSYLQVLELSNHLLSFPRAQSLYGERESGSVAALQQLFKGSGSALPTSGAGGSDCTGKQKQLLTESLKCLSFMTNTSGSCHALGFLIRFIEQYLREQERSSRAYTSSHQLPTTIDGELQNPQTAVDSEHGAPSKEEAITALARVEAAPLVLLDYMGYLGPVGNWAMVCWAFSLTETSLRILQKHRVTATSLVVDVAARAILSQLRAVALPGSLHLPLSMLRSLIYIGDWISDVPLTLLGFDRVSLVHGLFRSVGRGEYRTVVFALKQAVVFLQRISVKYRDPPIRPSQKAGTGEEEEEGSETEEEAMHEGEGQGDVSKTYYTDAAAASHPAEEQQEFRTFFVSLLVCFDTVLDAIRSSALQQDILDDELRDVLILELQTLIRVLEGCVRAVLQLPVKTRRHLRIESAQVLWVSLCTVSAMSKVLAIDYRRVCFTGNIMRAVSSLHGVVGRLVESYTSSADRGATGGGDSGDEIGVKGGDGLGSDAGLLDTLTLGLRSILSGTLVTRRIALRLGLGYHYRTDFTAILTAVRTLASAAARYKPAGSIVHFVWSTLLAEVAALGKSRCHSGAALGIKDDVSPVRVPSKEELALLLDSFRDLEKEMTDTVAARQARGRMADYLVDWACPNAEAVLNSVVEDCNLAHEQRRGSGETYSSMEDVAAKEGICEDKKGLPVTDWNGIDTGGTGAVTVTALVEMDASALLDESENMTNAEALEAITQQCRRMQMTSTASHFNDTRKAIPQTNRVVLTHFNCLATVFNRCTLSEIMAAPGGLDIFASLNIFYRRQAPVPLERRRALWSHLASQWRQEFLQPDSERFHEKQRELLQLVRQRRGLIHTSEKGVEDNAVGQSKGVLPRGNSAIAMLSQHDMPHVAVDLDLLPHDDFSSLLAEERGAASPEGPEALSVGVRELPLRVPLEVLLTLLGDIVHGPRDDESLEELAKIIVTYVARQHVLLRQRCDGIATNVQRFMYDTPPPPRVYMRRRLPLTCTHAPAVAGHFFSEEERNALMDLLQQHIPGPAGMSASATLPFLSAEQGMFEYLRSLCLYLHMLALTANVCHSFRIFGDGGDASGSRSVEMGSVLRRGAFGLEEDAKDAAMLGGLHWKHYQQETGARIAERRARADLHQAHCEGVNSNLLENILLHFLNVSLVAIEHADMITHRATSIAITPGSDSERVRQALLYADELRLMVGVSLQNTLRLLLRGSPAGYSFARRVAHRIISMFSCEDIPLSPLRAPSEEAASSSDARSGGEHGPPLPDLEPASMMELAALRCKRPELFLRSPTLLCILSPAFFNEVLSQHIRNAMGFTLTQVVASLHFYLRSPTAHLGPLMTATANILSSTNIRNAALRLFCEELCGQIMERDDFRDALAPPTVVSSQQGALGSVPNEVLIPFLAAMSREDVCVTKSALTAVLHRAMSLRSDVFGQPPTANRFSRLAIARSGSAMAGGHASMSPIVRMGASVVAPEGLLHDRLSLGGSPMDVVLESAVAAGMAKTRPNGDETSLLDEEVVSDNNVPSGGVGSEEQEEVTALSRFSVNQGEYAPIRTHKRALASLNLTLAEVMETAMHFSSMRRLTSEEYKRATSMIRSADDARHERVASFRSVTPPPETGFAVGSNLAPSDRVGVGHESAHHACSTTGMLLHPDAALHIEDPTHFGVVMLHINFALRKIIHVSMRRLAAQQGPRTLCMMVEMLKEVDPKWHHASNNEHRRQMDGMLAGTLRVLSARALACVDLVGDAGDLLGGGAGGIAMSAAGLQRAERALYLVQHREHHGGSNSSGSVVTKGKGSCRS
ncbi:hypothetical protein TRVL_02377 [Trypanosoma vivax]|nr:hypothetical protein TRVL_02377 [Trypanosoma vivax]